MSDPAGIQPASTRLDNLPEELVDSLTRIRESLELQPRYLPHWPAGVRTAPNEILRSALFTVRNRNQTRAYLKDSAIVVIGEGEIRYRGEELRQDDELVWLHLLHLGKSKALGECVEFSGYSFLKDLGWPANKGAYRRLKTSLFRMMATAVEICSPRLRQTVAVPMIYRFRTEDPETKKPLRAWQVWISPEMCLLFGDGCLTRINWEQRKRLPVGIATKLHGYWSTHRQPFAVRVETLQKLCGSETLLKHFRTQLIEALEILQAEGFLREWRIDEDLVLVVRPNKSGD
jgi:hypothetical protein